MTTNHSAFFSLIISALLGTSGCGFQDIPKAENGVEAAWAEVVNQYKRRADLIPNLVKVVKAYAEHERDTLEAVTAARARATSTTISFDQMDATRLAEMQKAQGALSSALSRLLLVSERYPELKANENFQDLQTQLEGTENRITVARGRYIEAVRAFNDLVSAPPSSWTNSLFYHHDKFPQFSVEDESIERAPEIDL